MNNSPTLLLTAALILFSIQTFGQVYDFEDAVIPSEWIGDRTNFQVSSSNQLQLNAPVGSTASSLSWTSLNAENCSWEFYLKYAFAASTTNYSMFYLLSTEAGFTSVSNVSYYLKIGGATGTTDKIELIYQQGLIKQVVLESRTGIAGGSQVSCRIQVLKDASGLWVLKTDNAGFFNFTTESSAKHWIANPFKYSGIRCVYSSTRRDKIYFDDIDIREPFVVKRYQFENDSTLRIIFNKTLDTNQQPNIDIDFTVPYTTINGADYLLLVFATQIHSKSYKGVIGNIYSNNGEPLFNTSIEITKEIIYYVGQIRISEWMSDPSPSYGLPEVEWVELVNMSVETIDLNKISISDPSSKVTLPQFALKPDSVVVVCSLNSCKYFSNKNCIEVSSLPSLNNSGDSIFLWANESVLIDFVQYDLSVMSKDFRSEGGYSIERKTFPEDCYLSQDIAFSSGNNGGKPGFVDNRIKKSSLGIEITAISDVEIKINMNINALIPANSFHISMEISNLVMHSNSLGPAYNLYLNQKMKPGSAYTIHIDSVRTCRNKLKFVDMDFELIYSKPIEKNEVFLNEILYNPNSGGVDFIELYNNTSDYIQLQRSHFYNNSDGKVQHLFLSDNCIIKPLDYIVLTGDRLILKQEYENAVAGNCIQIKNFLSLPDAGGSIIWLNENSDTLDQVFYGDVYHNPLNRNSEGYSLEKIVSFDPIFYASNWTTSATYTTAGYVNSQQLQMKSQNKPFYCTPCHVTTNLNGANDFAILHMSEDVRGCFGSIGIYKLSGEKVIDVIINQLLGSVNSFQWNGENQGGGMLEDGIYVAVAQWWSSDGKTYTSKIAISTSQY